jgi:hypothetical protein
LPPNYLERWIRASTRFSSITDLQAARSLALDDDLAVLRAQFNLANVSAHHRGENYPRR